MTKILVVCQDCALRYCYEPSALGYRLALTFARRHVGREDHRVMVYRAELLHDLVLKPADRAQQQAELGHDAGGPGI